MTDQNNNKTDKPLIRGTDTTTAQRRFLRCSNSAFNLFGFPQEDIMSSSDSSSVSSSDSLDGSQNVFTGVPKVMTDMEALADACQASKEEETNPPGVMSDAEALAEACQSSKDDKIAPRAMTDAEALAEITEFLVAEANAQKEITDTEAIIEASILSDSQTADNLAVYGPATLKETIRDYMEQAITKRQEANREEMYRCDDEAFRSCVFKGLDKGPEAAVPAEFRVVENRLVMDAATIPLPTTPFLAKTTPREAFTTSLPLRPANFTVFPAVQLRPELVDNSPPSTPQIRPLDDFVPAPMTDFGSRHVEYLPMPLKRANKLSKSPEAPQELELQRKYATTAVEPRSSLELTRKSVTHVELSTPCKQEEHISPRGSKERSCRSLVLGGTATPPRSEDFENVTFAPSPESPGKSSIRSKFGKFAGSIRSLRHKRSSLSGRPELMDAVANLQAIVAAPERAESPLVHKGLPPLQPLAALRMPSFSSFIDSPATAARYELYPEQESPWVNYGLPHVPASSRNECLFDGQPDWKAKREYKFITEDPKDFSSDSPTPDSSPRTRATPKE